VRGDVERLLRKLVDFLLDGRSHLAVYRLRGFT
jgi:hypothetical protein